MRKLSKTIGLVLMVVLVATMFSTAVFALEETLTGVDECENFDLAYEKSDQLGPYYIGEDQQDLYFYDEYHTFQRAQPSEEWVTYKIPAGNMMTVETYFWPGEPIEDFTFYVSSDNENWTECTPSDRDLHEENAGNVEMEELSDDPNENKWPIVTYTLSGMPDDTEYVKIAYEMETGTFWAQMISQVSTSEDVEPQSPATSDVGMLPYLGAMALSMAGFVTLKKKQK